MSSKYNLDNKELCTQLRCHQISGVSSTSGRVWKGNCDCKWLGDAQNSVVQMSEAFSLTRPDLREISRRDSRT
jgi:hypothetical protein